MTPKLFFPPLESYQEKRTGQKLVWFSVDGEREGIPSTQTATPPLLKKREQICKVVENRKTMSWCGLM